MRYAAYFPIRVLPKALSGASVKTRILRVRRSIFASVRPFSVTKGGKESSARECHSLSSNVHNVIMG